MISLTDQFAGAPTCTQTYIHTYIVQELKLSFHTCTINKRVPFESSKRCVYLGTEGRPEQVLLEVAREYVV